MAATHQAPPSPPPQVRRPAPRTLSPEESKKNRLLLASLKEELVLLKGESQLGAFKKKHSAVLNYIQMKSIAQQWINNTYEKMTRKQGRSLRNDAREQMLSDEVTPDKYLRQREDPLDILWKRDFTIYANGDWGTGFAYSPPTSPPKSPTQETSIGKMSILGEVPRKKKQKKKQKKNNPVEKLTLSQVNAKKHVTFPEGGHDDIAIHLNRYDDHMILPNPRDNYTESPTKKNDGPMVTPEVALANAIEIWYRDGFKDGIKSYSEFWDHPQIQKYKKQGFLGDFGKLIKNSIKDYDAGKKVSFKSKSPFRMTDSLKSNLAKMLFQYSKKYPTNAEAKPFIMPVKYS